MLKNFKKEEKTMPRGKTWSKEEIQLLYELSSEYTPHQISKKLGRTTEQVVSKQEKKKIQGFCITNVKYISCRALANILQVDSHVVLRWKNIYEDFPKRKVKVVYSCREFVVFDKILGWLEEHQELFDASKVEPYAFTIEPQWLKDKRTIDYQKHQRRNALAWTSEDDSRLVFLTKCGKTPTEIANELQRTVGSIYHRKSLLGLTVSRKENKINDYSRS